ncbi:putative DNA-directed RNA polymerase III subunit RPC2 [Monocercomonoides exilis]|uniref:putative DNA-directed RNA polymerase III subunit RPC2 n=1 Tax=Monocercomonoides exilis TaxID=2049356 RepID=UPI003559C1CB|nr:putative DNA-directed RNA polymerase III subunit RPC2 [Monocercomonoides exilis]|eukprot:MONOS_11794.1-p1 / transcript=MONOS_11794.1 / gene=MONOS_11794 / organism=Monocercomonoides_exilis_PA203 / gene_product=DNA-directed RNA polymerase III subunit RPC2 / transcript_product=DNA-directed RNA polymerase III subunit RPC2 / location=Mono_scaffold00612:8802-13150(-) / protein_length=1125 / sequence_SO=supercontig / SO=protein_coding / is_pseudo=false
MSVRHKTDEEILDEKWRMLPYFLKMRGLLKNHIDSFNHFLDVEIKQIIEANKIVRCEDDPSFWLEYLDVHIGKPAISEDLVLSATTPQMCRLRDLTYSAPVYVDVRYTKEKTTIVTAHKKLLCHVPIMLRSNYCVLNGKTEAELARLGECPLDPGGYFIVKGTEKVILIQEQLSKNRVIIDESSKSEIFGTVTSSTAERKSRTDILTKKGKYYLHHSTLSEDIPIGIALRAMGVESDSDIVAMVGCEPVFRAGMTASMEEAALLSLRTQKQALEWIGNRIKLQRTSSFRTRADEAMELLSSVVFPHIASPHFNFRNKAIFVASIVRKIIIASHDKSALDDKDYYGNKRLELAGQLLSLLFEDRFKFFNDELKRAVEQNSKRRSRAYEFDITKSFRPDLITGGFVLAISTGNWTLRRFHMDRQGVTQPLARLSFISTYGMMTRLSSQFEKSRKVSGPRSLQPSQFGMICPSDTPEGESCGLVKNFALLTHVTTDDEMGPIVEVCYSLGVEALEMLPSFELHRYTHVVFNGVDIGVHRNPRQLVRQLRLLRRQGKIGEFVSIVLEKTKIKNEVTIASDSGRVCRPLIIVEKGKSVLTAKHMRELYCGVRTFADCLREGLLEYVDVNEENDCMIALSPKDITPETTHLEVDCMSILGVVAGLIPFPHHNQSPRNTYQCAMGKQAMGSIAFNQHKRIDTLFYSLVSPQRPLTKTRVIDMIGYNQLPAGMNAVVGVVSYSGYDIEDAIILNKSSLDRGFARCVVSRKASTTIRIYPNQVSDRIVAPLPQTTPPSSSRFARHDRYAALDRDGIAGPGEKLEPEDIWCNKWVPLNTTQPVADVRSLTAEHFTTAPEKYRGAMNAVVDQVLISSSADSPILIKALMRQVRRPEVGDKFSSRHGQKGVCGLIVEQQDMPFTDQGICPDLIMNPHGYPSRMTVAKLKELVTGKAAVMEGRFRDATAFKGDPVEEVCKSLVKHGFNYGGKDFLYSGITGQPLSAYIFFGPLFYQKLKHMVLDKMHARSRGPRAMMTRQPTEGRSRDGGLRLGEMERDCLVGYGAALLMMERLMLSSDVFHVSVCNRCGLIGYKDWCQHCRSTQNVFTIRIPYACKLLFQELQSMNVVPRLSIVDEM